MKKPSRAALPALVLLALLAIWEALVRALGVPAYVLPSPTNFTCRCSLCRICSAS